MQTYPKNRDWTWILTFCLTVSNLKSKCILQIKTYSSANPLFVTITVPITHNVNLMYYIGITDTILLFQWLFPNSEQAKNFVSRYKVAGCIFASISANFSPIFKSFFFFWKVMKRAFKNKRRPWSWWSWCFRRPWATF